MIFETMLAIHGRIVQLDEHFARLSRSARELGLPSPDDRALREFDPGPDECVVRCVYDGTLTISSAPIPPATLHRRNGARAITLDRSIIRESPQHKLTSYAEWLRGQAIDADEGFFVDRRGHVLEGMTTNVFAIDGDTLITAPLNAGILPGIVRAWVLENAKVIERAPTVDELREGGFITSSLTMLAPLTELDGRPCRAPGRAFTELRERYRAMSSRA